MVSINCEINRILAKPGQPQLLNYEDERCSRTGVSRSDSHLGGRIQSRHDRLSVGIDKLDSNRFHPFFYAFKSQFDG